MQPEHLTTPRSLTSTLRLSPSLKIVGVGVEGELSRSEERHAEDVFLQALYEGLPTPMWELTSTRTAQIAGLHRFGDDAAAPATWWRAR